MKVRRRHIVWTAVLLVTAAGGALLVASLRIGKVAAPHLFTAVDAVPANDVGLLLGCSPRLRSGHRNPYFDFRIEAAAALFAAGKVKYILASGDNRHENYNEPIQLQNALIERGIPRDRIVLDYAGFRTLDSVVRAHKVFGLSRFTVISQRFHNERAVYLARSQGIEAIGFDAHTVTGAGAVTTEWREVLARMKAVLDLYVFGTAPHFLGEPIRIGEGVVAGAPG